MDNAEVEVALEELENRLERLRALYEQYFMGLERIEPQVPRKDVDRRIYVLRREKIRNTAKRFKLQTIISRYNTFQQYWSRICREIENGTYKRHVIRAERIAPGQMLTIAARKRLGKAALQAMDAEASPPPPASVAPAAPAVPSAPPPAPPAPVASPVPRPGMPSLLGKPPPKPGARPPAQPSAPGAIAPAPAARPAAPSPASAAPAARPAAPAARPAAPSALDLDLSFLDDWDPGEAPSNPKRAPGGPAQPFGRALTHRLGAGPPPPLAPKPATASGGSAFSTKPGAASSVADELLVAPPFVSPRVPAAPPALAPRVPTAPARPPPAARVTSTPTAASGPAPRVPPLAPKDAPAATTAPRVPPLAPKDAPAATPAAKPLPAPLGAKALAAPIPEISPLPPVARPAATVAVKPPAAPPATAPKPAPPKPAPPKPAAAPAPPPDERVRELHARLLEAKRQTQDASTVSMEGLARSMKATEAKLREQHQNRKIDFDVVIKDGKAVLKPIVR